MTDTQKPVACPHKSGSVCGKPGACYYPTCEEAAAPQAQPAQPAQRLTDEPQWQPIETAPKDGTQYLACDGKKMWARNQPPNCYAGDWECNQNRTLWRGHADGLNPTHWMPLPEALEAGGEG